MEMKDCLFIWPGIQRSRRVPNYDFYHASRMERMVSAVPSFVRRRAVVMVARAPRPGLAARSVAQTANGPWKSLCLHAQRSSPLFLPLPFLLVFISRQWKISLYSSPTQTLLKYLVSNLSPSSFCVTAVTVSARTTITREGGSRLV